MIKPGRTRVTTHEVMIDGTRYVPVTSALPGVAEIENAIVSQWAGDNWRTLYPDAPTYLRVIVGDSVPEDEGETVADFLARLVASLPMGEAPGGH